MKNLFLFFSILFFFACNQVVNQEAKEEIPATDNKELAAIYEADQNDRRGNDINWMEVSKRDDERKARVYELLEAKEVRTSQDYYNAAMVFQHGGDTVASGMAVKLMRKAVELDTSRSKWLLAAAIDRDLMRRGQPQIYGTQYTKQGPDAPWELHNLDTTKISDEERIAYGVRTLAQQRQRVIEMNKKTLDILVEEGKSIDEIVAAIEGGSLDPQSYNLSESGINNFGYDLLGDEKTEAALKIFELNTRLYPDAYNTHDSLGECLLKLGRKEEGIKAYKKSLELNPDNDNAAKILAEMEKN